MINAIVFSFDRASQLHLLLESIEKHAKSTFNINVLYKSSNEDFKKGYELLQERFKNVNFVEETQGEFKQQTLKLMETELEFSCFMIDDDILFGRFEEDKITKILKNNDDILVFSPRQGLNTSFCYSMKCDNVILPDSEDDDFIYWNWTKRYVDAGCPFSLDGHIFRTKEIKKMVKATSFTSQELLMSSLNENFSENYPREKMFSCKQSLLVGVPVNIVQNAFENRQEEKFGTSTKGLNDKYLNGEIIDYEALDFSNINSAHCELKYEFKNVI